MTDPLRAHLTALLTQPQSHPALEQVLEDFPMQHMDARPAGSPHTPWQLLWHIRFTQRDLLDYMSAGAYTLREWPADYWPTEEGNPLRWKPKPTRETWRGWPALVRAAPNLLAPVPHAQEPPHTFLRSALLAADHAAYHTGQLALLRQILNGADGL